MVKLDPRREGPGGGSSVHSGTREEPRLDGLAFGGRGCTLRVSRGVSFRGPSLVDPYEWAVMRKHGRLSFRGSLVRQRARLFVT
jgi:hypothetical protein